MLAKDRFVVYGGTRHHDLDDRVLQLFNQVTGLGLEFSHFDGQTWPDGEPAFLLEEPERIRGKHAIIFSCPTDYKLECELRDFVVAAKKQYGARSVLVVLSFLRYRRQDHEELNEEITRLRWFIDSLKHWGADELIVCEPHSVEHTAKFCREFGLQLRVSDPTRLFAAAIRDIVNTVGGPGKARIYSPDFGSVGRAILLARELGVQVLATPKIRRDGEIVLVKSKEFLKVMRKKFGANAPVSCEANDLSGLTLFMREDELDSGTTAVRTAEKLRLAKANQVWLVVTHPVCSPGWKMKLFPRHRPTPFDGIFFGNTRPRGREETKYEGSTGGRITEIDMAPVIAGTLIESVNALK